MRERGWEGLPPPPVFTTGERRPIVADQGDPVAAPVPIFLGLPNGDIEPQIPRPPPLDLVAAPDVGPQAPLEFVAAPEADGIPASPTHSPAISIATLSDFAVTDVPDDEYPINPAAATPHETFYFEDGNAEVLCGNTLFRVHTTILSLHSPALRRMFSLTSLATADSPNGCPRIMSSDTPKDFATLLKTVYLPGFVALPTCH